MARTPDVLDDPTPLDSPSVDVRVRVAWLLRMSRAVGRDGTPLSVTEMALRLKDHGIPASAPSVSGWETGRVAPGRAVLEAYEAVLGRDPGILRGAVDTVRRILDQPRVVLPSPDLEELDRAAERVLGTPRPTGLDWLRFAEAALAVRPGLPRRLLRPPVDQLLSELSRAVHTAYVTRYEALALLRCGQYGGLVLDAIGDFVHQPGNQVVAEAMALATEQPDRAALELLLPHLGGDSPVLARGAVIGLEYLSALGGLSEADWRRAVTPLVRATNAHADDEDRLRLLSRLWPSLPPAVRAAATPRLPRSLGAAELEVDPLRRARELTFCRRLADRVCDRAGVLRQPLLTRLLYEAGFDHRAPRSWTATLIVMASPLRAGIARALADAADRHGDAAVREAATALLVGLGNTEVVQHAARWLDGDDPSLLETSLITLAHTGGLVPDERLGALLEKPDPVDRRALYFAGMTGHPVLRRLAADPRHRLHLGARWWQQHGTVVTA